LTKREKGKYEGVGWGKAPMQGSKKEKFDQKLQREQLNGPI